MRLNKYVALATGISRRAADAAIQEGRVLVNDSDPSAGQAISSTDVVTLDAKPVFLPKTTDTILLHKPVGYICSRDGQGGKTIYDLLPPELHTLKSVGRLDKESSGLLLLTNDGDLAQRLTHPSYEKLKVYKIALNKDLTEADFEKITKRGVELNDGTSRLGLDYINNQNKEWKVVMREGRNRQIRRTFEALGYRVIKLHRTQFGEYKLLALKPGSFISVQ